MDNKLIVSENYIANLPPVTQDLITLKINEVPYNTLSEKDKQDFCVDVITVAFAETGVSKDNISKEILRYQALTELFNELKGKFGSLTRGEIKKAFNSGVRRDFGPYMGLNAVSYNMFLKGFISLPQRIEAMRELNKITDKPNEMIYTEDEKKQIMINSAVNNFYEFKAGKELDFYVHRIYDFLNAELGIEVIYKNDIKAKTLIRSEDRQQVKQNALDAYKKYVDYTANELKFNGRMTEAKKVQECFTNLQGNRTYENFQKREALKTYFLYLIADKKDLKDLL